MSTPIGKSGLTRINSAVLAGLAVIGSANKVAMFDDFLGDEIAAQWNYTEGTDAATSAAAILAGGAGGVLRITSGDAGTGLAADGICLAQELQWKAVNGGLVAEARLSISRITNVHLFFGFTDVKSLEVPIESSGSGNGLTTTASNAVGILFDTRMTDDYFWLTGVKGDVDATAQNTGTAPVADTYVRLTVSVDALGQAVFAINGVVVGSTMVNAVTPATALTPILSFGPTSVAASITCDLDYMGVSMDR